VASTFCGDSFFGQNVIGIDEAGRGPLAGPVVAAGVLLDTKKPIFGLNDSKKIKEKTREDLYQQIHERAVFISVHEIDVATIDRINILQATLAAMKQVILDCLSIRKADVILIDGNRTVSELSVKQIAVVKGDSLIECIMAASIVAKVHRDRIMRAYEEQFPGYGFKDHKGYGTKGHLEAIQRLGPCAIHRMSFSPLRALL
jgi:ribonuclease HII